MYIITMTIRNTRLCKHHKVSKVSLRYGNKCSRGEHGVVGLFQAFCVSFKVLGNEIYEIHIFLLWIKQLTCEVAKKKKA